MQPAASSGPSTPARRRASSGAGLTVQVTDARGRPIRSAGLSGWLARVAPARARGTVTVAVVSDARVRALNRQYRGQDHATDVLSFPSAGRTGRVERRDETIPSPEPRDPFLGDIVIARGVARRQARRAGHGEPLELRILALHGLLHLLGYDHERDTGQMARLERKLRRKGGLSEGLTERGRR
jgi:probable rRNA maturation factor